MKLAWSHNAVLYRWCSFSYLNHYPREFNILQKKRKLTTWAWQNIAGNHRIPWQKKIAFSYSDPGDNLKNKLNDLKPLYSCKKSVAFQKKLKKMLCPWRVNLANQNNNRRKWRCLSCTIHDLSVWKKPLIDTCQYCSTSWANKALRSLTNAGFQNRGVCLQAFPSFLPRPLPSPLFHFLVLV